MRRRQMNPRQRQGLLLVIIATVGLLGVFLLIANYVSTISRQVGPKIYVLRLVAPLAPYQPVTANDLGQIAVPQKWAPSTALTDPSQALQLISQVSLQSGTVLEQGMLTQPPTLAAGQEKIAILVDAETGVANQIQPGDKVAVVATFDGTNTTPRYAEVVVPSVEVLGAAQVGATSGISKSAGQNGGLPVTLALTPAQVLKVSYAESFAQKVRLSIISPQTTGRPHTPRPYVAKPPRP